VRSDPHGFRANRTQLNRMSRFLVIAGALMVVAGLVWPWVSRLGLGRLPGDIIVQRGNFTLYMPIATGLLVSVVLSLILWFIGR
jgi:hypothetical protein